MQHEGVHSQGIRHQGFGREGMHQEDVHRSGTRPPIEHQGIYHQGTEPEGMREGMQEGMRHGSQQPAMRSGPQQHGRHRASGFERNVGGMDRKVRWGVGLGLLPLAFASKRKAIRIPALLLSGAALTSAATRFCPANRMLGANTAHR